MTVIKLLFWLSLFLLVYNYFFYPLLLWIFARIKPQKIRSPQNGKYQPKITLIISAYNEEKVIEQKLKNALSIDYPAEKTEIIVVSDASTDQTDMIVEKISKNEPRIKLIRLKERGGKSVGLNKAVAAASGDIVIFSDANAIYRKDAFSELTRYFQDERVGFVVGNATYYEDAEEPASANEGLYWKYETKVKELESDFHSVCVGDGAIYAIRRSLYRNLEPDDIGDFVNPLIIAAKSYLGVFNRNAVCYESAAGDFQKEFSRKRRIVNRSFRAFKKYLPLFSFQKHKKFLFELFSHKLIRWFNWLLVLVLFFTNLILVLFSPSLFYNVFFALQIVFGLLSLVGFYLTQRGVNLPSLLYFPYYYVVMNWAACLGVFDEFRGVRYVTWDHVRKS